MGFCRAVSRGHHYLKGSCLESGHEAFKDIVSLKKIEYGV